ncbi:MAG: hypothetical protein IIB56_18255 [Planctomycetes bacterium]|nr:hypothetical protein [Planctomycetota bacterium]
MRITVKPLNFFVALTKKMAGDMNFCTLRAKNNYFEKSITLTVRRNLLLTSVAGCPKFRMSGHLLKGLAVKCSRQLPFSYQFAGVGQEKRGMWIN